MKIKEYYEKVSTEYRCNNCNRLLLKAKISGDYYCEIKCPRCKNTTIFNRRTKREKIKS